MSEEAQKGNKEGASSDPRGIPAERQQEWWGVAVGRALQKMVIKKLHFVRFSFFQHLSVQIKNTKHTTRDNEGLPQGFIKKVFMIHDIWVLKIKYFYIFLDENDKRKRRHILKNSTLILQRKCCGISSKPS